MSKYIREKERERDWDSSWKCVRAGSAKCRPLKASIPNRRTQPAGPNSGVIALQLPLHSWTLPPVLGQGKTTLQDLYPWPWSMTKSNLAKSSWNEMLSAAFQCCLVQYCIALCSMQLVTMHGNLQSALHCTILHCTLLHCVGDWMAL